MILQVNEDWRIASDPLQWIVQRRYMRKGKADWKSVAFHGSINAAAWWLAQRRVREIPGTYPAADGLDALHDALRRIRWDIRSALESANAGQAHYHDTDDPPANGNVVRLPLEGRIA